MMMAGTAVHLSERVRMDNRRAMFDMDMDKSRDTAIVGDKNHRQQPFQIFSHRLSHALIVWKVQNYKIFFIHLLIYSIKANFKTTP